MPTERDKKIENLTECIEVLLLLRRNIAGGIPTSTYQLSLVNDKLYKTRTLCLALEARSREEGWEHVLR